MKHSLIAGASFAVALGSAGLALAQTYYQPPSPPFQLRPAPPESMPTVSPYSAWPGGDLSGTSMPTIAATPGCGAANPQGGLPAMTTGNCP